MDTAVPDRVPEAGAATSDDATPTDPAPAPVPAADHALARVARRLLTRRGLLQSSLAVAATASGALAACAVPAPRTQVAPGTQHAQHGGTLPGVPLGHQHHTGDVSLADGTSVPTVLDGTLAERLKKPEGLDPMTYLTTFDYGRVSQLPGGRTLREYYLAAVDKEIEVAPGVMFPAWTYNGQVPGPTLRATEGDLLRIHFTNGSAHPHTIHFHGIHPANMDGVFEIVAPGKNFVYEFDAEPFGLHLYHCHTMPLAKHIAKGLYGTFIIDPKAGRPKADHEFVMMMNGFDIDFDNENDFYAVNSAAFFYQHNPIPIKVGALVRIYLVNILEFDQSNSFHLHANFFNYYPTGTRLEPNEFTDTIAQMQGQRGILEFRYKFPGTFMVHAHKTEFAELGWTGLFKVEP
jgi:FtsP/CotA-like multicopper oxidase with cupredoxin domain